MLAKGETKPVTGKHVYQDALRGLPAGYHAGTLVREPDNHFDRNAIGVHVSGSRIGHVPKDTAAIWAKRMDRSHTKRVACRVLVVNQDVTEAYAQLVAVVPVSV